ncbi:Di-copper centre-containing protein [Hyaloscypha variabilis F]|uniref:Di-copper centre-containing protein n=1 Tax=Hyaloscypha variabilis (strain UAMH 11265 / GT02V1 / F) TaxID=1149755 RepID=A0A2J6R7T9_HYAVF|nr:Di-copper centre-containing protein [Hyaloscypha variabilis F]
MIFTALILLSAIVVAAGAGPAEKKFSLNWRTDGPYPLDSVDELQEASLSNFAAYLAKHPSASNCTLENAARRMEWHDFTLAQRQEYTKAVLRLQSKAPIAPKKQFPGSMNRFDDFVATHESQVSELHSTPHLLPAHRLYIWAYEKALRDECGYTGYQPYWNWDRTAADPINSPLFNGDEYSMGGNGLPVKYAGVPTDGFAKPYDIIPSAGGGGCVTKGPFANMTVSLGPFDKTVPNLPNNPRSDGYGHNPRCLKRDVNKYAAAVTTANYSYALITQNPSIDDFQNVLLGTPAKNDWGVHIGGHYTIGGDPGGDFYSSPGDPVFYAHHGMIDRLWWIWQMQDPEKRMSVLPSNPPATDTVDLGFAAKVAKTYDLNNNIGGYDGQFCFIYV